MRTFGVMCVLIAGSLAQAAADGLVGHWDFNEGQGRVAQDKSGFGHHGRIEGATYADSPLGHALRFDGVDDFVDCAKHRRLAIESGGTVMLWYRLDTPQGGLVNWSTGDAWTDERLVVAFNTYSGGDLMIAVFADGEGNQMHALPPPPLDTWTHFALTFDGVSIKIYQDGVPIIVTSQNMRPKLKDVPFWIGKCQGLGKASVKGLLDEVRVYSHALPPVEVLTRYKEHAEPMGKDPGAFHTPHLTVTAFDEPGWIAVDAKVALMRPLPAGACCDLALFRKGSANPVRVTKVALAADAPSARVTFKAGNLPPGDYEVRAQVRSEAGLIGKMATARVAWPGRAEAFKNVKVLNNLVWELLHEMPGAVENGATFGFHAPKPRWAYVRATGRGAMRFALGKTADILRFEGAKTQTIETMRALPAGKHTLTVTTDGDAHIDELVVRSIPELIYAQYFAEPHVKPFGPFAGDFMRKYIEPNVTTFVTNPGRLTDPFIGEWTQRGGRWLIHCSVPGRGDEKFTGDAAAQFIAKTAGFTHPLAAGSIADEFGGSEALCTKYARGVEKLSGDPRYRNRLFYPYAGQLTSGPEGQALVRSLMRTGSSIAWKRYLKTQSNVSTARQFLKTVLVDAVTKYRTTCPGSVEHIAVCFGNFSIPPEFLNATPTVNYLVYLDMQFNVVATDPAFWATQGLMNYLSSYTDAETTRFTANLFRHYGIEGSMQPVSNDPHDLTHITNPDFADLTNGWTLDPAGPSSIRAVRSPGWGWLQGRYPRTAEGDTALLMTRSRLKPNAFSQKIRDLEPGRLYSMRMFTADEKNMGKQETHAIRIDIANAEVLPEHTFAHQTANCYSHHYGPYNKTNKAWMNYHWRVFRAKGKTAKLTVSDWATPTATGGPIGQRLLYNYVVVQPFFEAK